MCNKASSLDLMLHILQDAIRGYSEEEELLHST